MTKDQSTHEDSKSQPPAEKAQNITSLVTAFTLLGGAGILVAVISLIRALLFGLSDVQLVDSA